MEYPGIYLQLNKDDKMHRQKIIEITAGKGRLAANYSAWINALKTEENGVERRFHGSRDFVLQMEYQFKRSLVPLKQLALRES